MTIADIRKDYRLAALAESDIDPSPYVQFGKWFDNALSAQVAEPTAMSLATASSSNGGETRVSSRIVLLKGYDTNGFVFFTNYASRKGKDLAHNPFASLLFFWIELERQVRIEGRVEKLATSESDSYFETRPLGSRLGAWASPQSQVIPDRAWLEQQLAQIKDQYREHPPRPSHWGGYRLIPDHIEFWQGRESRLHDRILYRLDAGRWIVERLAP